MKKLIPIMIAIMFGIGAANASENILNAILLEGADSGYNIILRADSGAKIKKKVTDNDVLELTVKGMSASSNLSTLYRNVADVNSFVVENAGENAIKVYIQAPDIAKNNVIFETPDASPMPVHKDYTGYKFGAGILLMAFLAISHKLSSRKKYSKKLNFDLTIKDREMRLMKKYRDEITTIPSISYKTSPYSSKRVWQGETIRKFEYSNKH